MLVSTVTVAVVLGCWIHGTRHRCAEREARQRTIGGDAGGRHGAVVGQRDVGRGIGPDEQVAKRTAVGSRRAEDDRAAGGGKRQIQRRSAAIDGKGRGQPARQIAGREVACAKER